MELEEWSRWWRIQGEPELRALLMEQWDPVGVRGEPAAADEYDSYLGVIGRLLREGASAESIAQHLATVEHDWMGFETSVGQLLPVGEQVIAWYADSLRRWDETDSDG
jgi:hypothetical protein